MYVAPPMRMGAWSMARVLRQLIEYCYTCIMYGLTGTYQIVDKRIFRDFGVVIEYDDVDDPPMMLQIPTSDPMKSEHGTTFLFDNFIEDPMLSDNPLVTIDNINPVVTIDCVTVENSLILRPSVNSITLYKGGNI